MTHFTWFPCASFFMRRPQGVLGLIGSGVLQEAHCGKEAQGSHERGAQKRFILLTRFLNPLCRSFSACILQIPYVVPSYKGGRLWLFFALSYGGENPDTIVAFLSLGSFRSQGHKVEVFGVY